MLLWQREEVPFTSGPQLADGPSACDVVQFLTEQMWPNSDGATREESEMTAYDLANGYLID